jgi:hypothetical protein
MEAFGHVRAETGDALKKRRMIVAIQKSRETLEARRGHIPVVLSGRLVHL